LRTRPVDIGHAGIDAESLAFLDLQLFVDQILDHFLPRRSLMRCKRGQLAALLDIVVGDGLAIDHHDNGLCAQLCSAAADE
jgi:hypothetical protein